MFKSVSLQWLGAFKTETMKSCDSRTYSYTHGHSQPFICICIVKDGFGALFLDRSIKQTDADPTQSAMHGHGVLDPVHTRMDACLLTLSGILSEYSETLYCQEKQGCLPPSFTN